MGATVVPIGAAKPNPEVVEMATKLLALAQSGELRDLVFCGTARDGAVLLAKSSSENGLARLAAVSRLLHNMHMDMDAGMSEATDD